MELLLDARDQETTLLLRRAIEAILRASVEINVSLRPQWQDRAQEDRARAALLNARVPYHDNQLIDIDPQVAAHAQAFISVATTCLHAEISDSRRLLFSVDDYGETTWVHLTGDALRRFLSTDAATGPPSVGGQTQ